MTTMQPELSAGPDDDFATELLARRRRRLPVVTAILTVGVAAGIAFIAGAYVQKHYGHAASTSSGSAAASAFARFRSAAGGTAGGGFAGGRGGFFGAGGGVGAGTVGTVTLIKGSTLYVTSASGNTAQVVTSAATRVTRSVRGTVQTIHPGDTVAVTGAQGANGAYTATVVSITSGGSSNGQ